MMEKEFLIDKIELLLDFSMWYIKSKGSLKFSNEADSVSCQPSHFTFQEVLAKFTEPGLETLYLRTYLRILEFPSDF